MSNEENENRAFDTTRSYQANARTRIEWAQQEMMDKERRSLPRE